MATTRDDWVFSLIEKAVAEGHRCPTNPEIAAFLCTHGHPIASSSIPKIMRHLVRSERVIVHVYPRNWRVVIIRTGPQAGNATMSRPGGGEALMIIDQAERAKHDAKGELREQDLHVIERNKAFR